MRYQLETLTSNEMAGWDELIAPYKSRELFHRRAWLDYLAASRGVEIRLWAIREAHETAGYLAGGILQKGPFRILGSPLKSWGTNFMGPIFKDEIDQASLLQALDGLAREEHLAMTELESRLMDGRVLIEANYDAVPSWTYLVDLAPGNPELTWNKLSPSCRNKVRQAERAGLTIEETSDPAVADEFYDRYIQLMAGKGKVPPYPREYPRLLFHHLKKEDLLFALRVRDRDGCVLATGLFPHDDRTIYFWGGSSLQDGRNQRPNDYLQWSIMRLGAGQGLEQYNMCGYGRFKKKFGGTLTATKRWHKCYWRTARWARRGYEFYFNKQMRLRAWLRRPAWTAD